MIKRETLVRNLRDHLWFGPATAGVFAISLAFAAYVLGLQYGDQTTLDIDESELVSLFGIFATSMLTVATFTIAAIVSSASTVTSTTTPRAARLVLSDGRGQAVLSGFIAAFIYSVIGILALQAFDFRPFGRFILFCGLIAIMGVVLVAFIGWIDRVQKLGRVETTIERLRDAALTSITTDTVGTFGARRSDGARPPGSRLIHLEVTGYVVELDLASVQHFADEHDLDVTILARPGDVVEPTVPIAYVVHHGDPVDVNDLEVCLRTAVVTSDRRQYEHDVRFNVVNLAETADRALSPGTNDPGTAINVLYMFVGVFGRWAEAMGEDEIHEVRFERVAVPPLRARELVADAFTAIARDGAGQIEVLVRLHKTLHAIERLGIGELSAAIREMAAVSLELAEDALVAGAHLDRVRDVAIVGTGTTSSSDAPTSF